MVMTKTRGVLALAAASLVLAAAAPAEAHHPPDDFVELSVTVQTVPARKPTQAETNKAMQKLFTGINRYLDKHPEEDICWNRPGVVDRPTCYDAFGVTLPRAPGDPPRLRSEAVKKVFETTWRELPEVPK